MKILQKLLADPPKCYRPFPFWSWNSRLDTEETKFQIEQMDKAGMGGFFMHARGGLMTEYMGEEWMDNVRASIDEGTKRGMQPWGYDENGWPSGFGDGRVTDLGEKYHQKYLYMEYTDSAVCGERTVANIALSDGRNMHFYYDTNPYYIDALDGEVTDAFIQSTHDRYKRELGEDFNSMTGFFTDEPQLSRRGGSIPWSLTLPREYSREYGEALEPLLIHLFETSRECYRVRYNYFRLVAKLFSENFMKRIYDWCNENSSKLTGHLALEENLAIQLDTNGAVMPSYRYMHIPGVDLLGRVVTRDLLVPQVASVCAQTGKKQILTESFGLCGWDVSFEELKWVLECQMVKGANLLCQHLSAYSLAGLRKRDYPASHFYQNPWWSEYKQFNDFASRMGMLLAEGDICCNVLLVHNISSAWLVRCDNYDWGTEIRNTCNKFIIDAMTEMDKNQIVHHLGDELMMETLASVEGDRLRVGDMTYGVVIVPGAMNLSSNTLALLKSFKKNGGALVFAGDVPSYIDGIESNEALSLAEDCPRGTEAMISVARDLGGYASIRAKEGGECDIQYTLRRFEDFTMHYFVNSFSPKITASFEAEGRSLALFDYDTGKIQDYPFRYSEGRVYADLTLEEKGSVAVFVYRDERFCPASGDMSEGICINPRLKGSWLVEKTEQNAITLDMCDVYFDGKPVYKNMHVIDVQEAANRQERKIDLKMEFTLESRIEPEGETFLVMEEAKHYRAFVNGQRVDGKSSGYFRDKSFEKLDISGMIHRGKNIIVLETEFAQSKTVYDMLRVCNKFEAIKNKLWYDREIEEIYVLGDFSVVSKGTFADAPNGATRTEGGFILDKPAVCLEDGDVVCQGLPFFTGSLTLSKTLELDVRLAKKGYLELEKLGSVLAKVTINGKEAGTLSRAPYRLEISPYATEGENKIDIELVSGFRNLLGPLHRGEESLLVAPGSFYKESRIFKPWDSVPWDEGYTFLKKGIFLK